MHNSIQGKARSFLVLTSMALTSMALTSACAEQAFCAKRAECETDTSADLQDVCRAEWSGRLKTLRANDEEGCKKRADALEALLACRAQLECSAFNKNSGQDCREEHDAVTLSGELSECTWAKLD